jgi:hypothetical protein
MADFIYNSEGRAQGFRVGSNIYALDGSAIGRVWAERAYRFDGTYVGVLFKNMVVDKPTGSRRSLPPVSAPPRMASPGSADIRRAINLDYPDVFHLLSEHREREVEETSPSAWPDDDPRDVFF